MKIKKANLLLSVLTPVITVLCIIIVWHIVAVKTGDEIILPTPLRTLEEIGRLLGDFRFYKAFFSTLLRSVIAFAFSFGLAFLLAIISKLNKVVKKVVSTLVPLLRSLPTIAIVLLLLLWTTSQVAPVIVTLLVVLPTTYTTLCEALEEVDYSLIEMCKTYGISKKRIVFEVYIPIILPTVLATIGSGLALNLKLMVAAEVLSQTVNSLGLLMNQSKIYFETATLLALVSLSVVTGLIFEVAGNFVASAIRGKRCSK